MIDAGSRRVRASPLQVAHIGAGWFSRQAHAPALRRLSGAYGLVLAGIADIDALRPARAQAFAADLGYARAFRDWREMLAAVEPDLIVCCVQPGMTAAVLREIVPNGVPVMVEKPPATAWHEASELAAIAAARGTPTYVGFNRRRMPAARFAKTWADRQTLQRLHVTMRRRRSATDGFAILTAIHGFDLARWLAGDVVAMEAHRSRGAGSTNNIYDVQMTCASGATARLFAAGEQDIDEESYVLDTGAERLELTVGAPYSDSSLQAGARVYRGTELLHEQPVSGDALTDTGMLGQYEALLDCLDRRLAPDCSLDDARWSLQLAIAAERSYAGEVGPALDPDGWAE